MTKRKINYPGRQDLNELPPGSQKFTNVGYQVGKFPVSLFERDSDQRKKHQNAVNRYSVMVKLAAYADPDGSNLWVGVQTLAESLGWGKATVHRHLKALREDGWIIGGGRRGENGSRMRRLVIPATAVKKLAPKVADSGTGEKQKSQIEPAEVANSGSEVADRTSEVASRTRVDLPSEPPQEPPPTSPKKPGLVGRLQKVGQESGVDLTVPGNAKKSLMELADRDGEEKIEAKCRAWLRTASFVGLNQLPIFKFLREYEDIDATVAQNGREYEEANAYIARFHEHMSGCELGTEEYAKRANQWIGNYPPTGVIASTLLKSEKDRHVNREERKKLLEEEDFIQQHAREI